MALGMARTHNQQAVSLPADSSNHNSVVLLGVVRLVSTVDPQLLPSIDQSLPVLDFWIGEMIFAYQVGRKRRRDFEELWSGEKSIIVYGIMF